MRAESPSSPRSTERGSIVIATSALMLLLLLGVALIAQSRVSVDAAAAQTDSAVADAFADRGVAEVLARIDGGERGSFSNSVDTDLGTYQYKVEQIDANTFVVRADGESDGVTRSVEVTIGGQDGYTLGVVDSAEITDNRGTIAGRVVTNGTIDATGTTVGDSVDLYGPGAKCQGCAAGAVFAEPIDLPYPERPEGETRSCPRDGRFTGIIDGASGVPYLCRRSEMNTGWVRFLGTVDVVNPPVIIYAETSLDVYFSNASVNATGTAADFQVIGEGDDNYWWFDTWNSKINGVLYAPGRDAWLSSSSIAGQLTVGLLTIRSPNDVWISPSAEPLELNGSSWYVTSFERVTSR